MPTKRAITLILIVFAASLFLFLFKVREEMADFEVNYKAAQRLRWGHTLYRVTDEHWQFKYMPVSSFLYLPTSLLPLEWAKALWFIIVLASTTGVIILTKRIVKPQSRKDWPFSLLPALVLLKFFFREIQLGQINSLVTFILLGMTWFLSEEKSPSSDRNGLWTGLCWGLAVALKPYALIFLPYFIVKKKWIPAMSGLGLLCAGFFAPSLYYGFKGNIIVHRDWISTLSQSTPTLLTTQDNVSIIAFFSKWIANQNLSFLFSAIAIALLALWTFFLIQKGRDITRTAVLECSVLLICIPLVSPLGWDYTFLMSILGLALILRHFSTYSRIGKGFLVFNLGMISLSLYDLMGKNAYSAFMSWSVLTLNFLILIGYLSFLRLKKIS